MDPAWVSIGIGLLGSIIGTAFGAAVVFGAMKAWMARREEREQSMGQHLGRLQNTVERHEGLLGDHAVAIGVLQSQQDQR